jgi:hypothetical protein
VVDSRARRRRGLFWVAVATAVLLVPAAAAFGPAGAVAVVAFGAQAAVASWSWPVVGRVSRRLVTTVIPLALGWLVVVMAIDVGAGALLDLVTGDDEDADHAAEVLDLTNVDLPPTTDPRIESPAFAGSPWADRYLAEMDELDYTHVPYLGPRLEPVRGRYVNGGDGVRASYGDDADGPVVWFFGGSTMWGEGQRDDHTIPSEVARLAEADGRPIRVVNYGERGYTAYQELFLFEQELAAHGPPDLAVFYDGINEVGTQQEVLASLSEQPTVYQYETVMDALRRAPAVPDAAPSIEPSIATGYAETSAIHKLLRRLELVSPAGAQEVAPLDVVIDNAASIYARSVALIRDLAERHGVPVVHTWQPVRRGDTIHAELIRRLPEGVVDLSRAFLGEPDDEAIFIDGGHTNELGALLVAEALWPHVDRALEEPVR